MSKLKKPNRKLQHERELRGWSQQKVAEELDTDEKRIGIWERGESIPSPFYRQKLCQLFGKNAQELGFLDDSSKTDSQIATAPQAPIPASISSEENAIIDTRMMNTPGQGHQRETEAIVNRRDFNRKVLGIAATTLIASDALTETELLDRFHRALKKPTTIDMTTLHYLRKRTGSYYQDRHDVNVVSFDVLTYALDHFRKVTDLLEEPLLPTIRTQLISIAGEIAQLIGELHFEMGNYPRARTYHKAAIKAAQEANDQALQSIALGWMSFAWTYSGDKQEALSCVQEARSLARRNVNATICAWLAAIEAEVQANLDNLEGCRRALDGAECVDEHTYSLEVSHWIHFDRSLLGGYQGICFLRLYRPGNTERSALLLNAKNSLTNALELLDPTLMRRRPTYLADLASVNIRQGEIEEACERANQTIAIAVQIKSQMVTERLFTLRRELEPWKNTWHVKNLDEHLAPLLPTPYRGNV